MHALTFCLLERWHMHKVAVMVGMVIGGRLAAETALEKKYQKSNIHVPS